MGGEWRDDRLGEIADFKNGKGLKVTEYREDGLYPVWGANGSIARTNHVQNYDPVVVIGRVGAYCGSVHRVSEPSWVTDNAIIAKAKSGTDFGFLYYLLKSSNLERTSIGSAQPLVTQSGLKTLPCFVPVDEAEQHAIAHILSSLDDKIELNRQMNRTLEQMAQAIFKSWFIDFDPVVYNAVQAGNPIPECFEQTAARYRDNPRIQTLPRNILDLFHDRFEDSELGEIPAGWSVKSLAALVQLIGGGTPKTKVAEYWDGNIPWFSVVDAPEPSDLWVIDTEKHVSQLGVDNSSTKVLPKGTTIISARGTVGKCALVGRPMAMNQSCYGVRTVPEYGEFFTNFLLRNKIEFLQQSGHGSVFNTITRSTFEAIKVVDCGEKISQLFDAHVSDLLAKILTNLEESKMLAEMRQTLLPKLISGELRIPYRQRPWGD